MVLISSVLTKVLASAESLDQRLALLAWLARSCESVAVNEMFLLKMTAAKLLTSALNSAIRYG